MNEFTIDHSGADEIKADLMRYLMLLANVCTCSVCDDPGSSKDNVMSDKHTISYLNNLLSSPHSGVLIGEESTFNFSLSRLAMPSCPSDLLFSASWNILENDRDLHADTKIERVSGCAFNTSTPRGIWCDEFLSWKLQGSYAFGTFSNNHSFCHLNLIKFDCVIFSIVARHGGGAFHKLRYQHYRQQCFPFFQ